jgi:hypothetical protein
MGQHGSPPPRRLGSAERRIVTRFAEVVCPPQVRAGDVMAGLLAEFESMLEALPSGVRSSVRIGMVAFDQGARLYPRARTRRFARLTDDVADAYFLAVLARSGGGLRSALQRMKGLVVMCYYELPEVKDQLGYRPDAYIAAVSRRRLASYGPQIRAAEAAVLAADPDPAQSPDAPDGQR